jgi:cytidine deaminase
MEKRSLEIKYEYFDGPDQLEEGERKLFLQCREVLKDAYSPYSRFMVGCVVELANGEIVTGVNQENAAFPSGFCAEMTALGRAGSAYPGVAVKRIVVCCNSLDFEVNAPVSPCGSLQTGN